MVKTRHGMKVFAVAAAEVELRGGLLLTCITESCDVSSPMLPCLTLCDGACHYPSPLSQTSYWAELLRHAWFVYTTWTLDV